MTDNLVDWVLVGLAASVVLGLILAVRAWIEGRRTAPAEAAEDNSPLTLPVPVDWEGRTDHAFAQMLFRTGLPLTPPQALGWMTLGGVVGAGLLGLGQQDLGLAGLGLALGIGVVLVVFLVLQRRWRGQLQDQLPNVFFLIARSLRAGLSLDQALTLVGEQGAEPAAAEFRRCAGHLQLGLAVPAALQLMADRMQLSDFNIFVSQLVVHRRVGGNLAKMLDRVAATCRDRNLFRGYFQAATAQGRLSGVCLSVAAPLLLFGYWFLHPEYVHRLTETPEGLTLLGIACLLNVIGITWLLYLFRIDY